VLYLNNVAAIAATTNSLAVDNAGNLWQWGAVPTQISVSGGGFLSLLLPAPVASAPIYVTPTGFTANWTAYTGATTYYLDVATDAGFSQFVPGYQNANVGNVTQVSLTCLDPKIPYFYRVYALVGGRATPASNTVVRFSTITPSLAADYFGTPGLWLYRNGAWSPLALTSPNRLASYENKLVANFADHGLYQYDGTTWTQIASSSGAENLVALSNKLVVDFGSAGLWQYEGGWTQLSPMSPDKLLANGNKLLATFPGFGLHQHDGTTWTQLSSVSPLDMIAISGKVYVNFGLLGLWKYDGVWTNLSTANPDKIIAYGERLVANFPGFGLHEHDGTAWTQLTSIDGVQDLIGIEPNLYADYGALGVYRYNGAWNQISTADSNRLSSYGEKLVANFPIYGLHEYDGSTWTLLTGNDGATDMIGVDLP
jgi:hypothetical protein